MANENAKIGLTGEEVAHAADPEGNGFNIKELMKLMGDDRFDADAFAASPDMADFLEGMSAMGRGEDTPAAIEYWHNFGKGLHKELHDAEDPLNRWASYVPLAAKESDRKFPLIFLLHGAHNPILMTEGYGMIQVAAENECIVIVPQNENLDRLLELLDYAKEHYPVDLSRVYMCGYSFGGFMTARNAWLRPDIFAGVGWGGMLFSTEIEGHYMDDQYYPEFRLTDEMIGRMKELKMPMLLFMGENEMLCLEPLWRDQEHKAPDHNIPLDSADKHRAFNNFRLASGCPEEQFKKKEYYENHSDPVVRSIGAEFERTEVIEDRGRKYFIGDSVNEDGECLFRTVSAQGMNHSTTRMWAPMIWEHISRYARDPETGRLISL